MIKKYFFGVFFAVFCVSLSLNVLVTDPYFTDLLLDVAGPEEAKAVTSRLFGYFTFQNGMPDIFTENEASHLCDVRNLLMANALLTLILAVLIWKYFNFSIAKLGALLLFSFLIVAFFLPFRKLFSWFHLIFFPQGNFIFAAESALITFYPMSFFHYYAMAVGFFGLVVAFTLLLFAKLKN